MVLWLMRAGKQGEDEKTCLDKGIIILRSKARNLCSLPNDRQKTASALEQAYPEAKSRTLGKWAGQVLNFVHGMQEGDLVAMPSKFRSVIHFGRIAGKCQPHPELDDPGRGLAYTRKVEWIKEISRNEIDQDLLYSFGSLLAICRISRNNAEKRIQTILSEEKAPLSHSYTMEETMDVEESEAENANVDLEQNAYDAIRKYLSRHFTGHELARLVEAILQAQGYTTYRSPAGADGGVDILAGSGPLGLESPKIAVQVKSGNAQIGTPEVDKLRGVIGKFKADSGLFVAWGGFSRKVIEQSSDWFEIRHWESEDIIKALLEHYENLPEDIQAQIPLKRIWIPVFDDEN